MVDIPRKERIKTAIFIKIAKTKFCFIILLVYLEILIPMTIFSRLSSIMTISDDSIAAALPIPPSEIPTLAKANEGASLIPSPIKAIFSSFANSFF